jgi:8-oxo-dGTP diphosphatase
MAYLIKPSVNVFLIKGDKVLLGRRANTGWMDGHLCPPGGHVEKGETPLQGALRELQEELGITVDPEHMEFICVAARNNQPVEYVAYEFMVRDKEYDVRNTEPDKCSELVWSELDKLPDDVISDFKQVIEQGILGGKKYLEIGF